MLQNKVWRYKILKWIHFVKETLNNRILIKIIAFLNDILKVSSDKGIQCALRNLKIYKKNTDI